MSMTITRLDETAVPSTLRDRRREGIEQFLDNAEAVGLKSLYCRLAAGAHLNGAMPVRAEDLLPYVEGALRIAVWPRGSMSGPYEGPALEALQFAYAFISGKPYDQQ